MKVTFTRTETELSLHFDEAPSYYELSNMLAYWRDTLDQMRENDIVTEGPDDGILHIPGSKYRAPEPEWDPVLPPAQPNGTPLAALGMVPKHPMPGDLGQRVHNSLIRCGIVTVEQVEAMDDEHLLKLRNFGRKMLDYVRLAVNYYREGRPIRE